MTEPVAASKVQTYTTHLNSVLLPALEVVRRNLAQLEQDIAEYDDLTHKLKQIQDQPGPQDAMMDLGAGVLVDVQIPDTSQITLDLGLDVHLTLPLAEAKEYTVKRVGVLQKRHAALKIKEENLGWQVEQFHGALNQTTG